MTILYIVNSLNIKGGVERILSEHVNYLVENEAIDILIATISSSTSSSYEYISKVRIKSLFDDDNKKNCNIFLRFIRFANSLRKVVDEVRPDLIVKVQTSGYTWIIPFVRPSVKKLLWIHTSKMGLELSSKNSLGKIFNKLYWKFTNFFFSFYSRVVLLTDEDAADWNLNNGVVVNNFTNFQNSFSKSSLLNKTAICVARYDYFKRIDLLIEIWERIHQNYPDWQLQVYGGHGDSKDSLLNKVKEKGLAECIFLNDACADIDSKYLESSIFCFTSRFEGFGLVLLEAMHFGLPVVAFSTVGVNTIVKDGYNGYRIDFGDIQEYENKLSKLIESFELRKQLSENAILSVSMFEKSKIMNQWVSLFKSMLKS